MIYATVNDYYGLGYSNAKNTDLQLALNNASKHIDVLTFNRIKFDKLAQLQKNIIVEVCCELADFELSNAEMLNSVIDSYSINGVSMQFGGKNIIQISGITLKKETYQKLCQTGLCYRGL